jgi:DHA1 family inner membrane transport protein
VQLPVAYAVGGCATAFSTPLIGWLSDRMDRLQLLAIMSTCAVVVVFFITRLGPSSVAMASTMMALFMVAMSGRFAPAMTMVTNAVEARYRGGFMSVNAALQQAASGISSILAGLFVTREINGHLAGLPALGYVSAGFFCLTVLLAFELRAAAPHVATPAPKDVRSPPPSAKTAA